MKRYYIVLLFLHAALAVLAGQLRLPLDNILSCSTDYSTEYAYDRNSFDYGARILIPAGSWSSADPLAHESYQYSPFSVCFGDPINFVDPTGKSTFAVHLGRERYEIIGGDLNDNDLNIYIGHFDDNDNFVKGESIGVTPLITSFYNSDTGEWAIGSVINRYDLSGWKFLNYIKNENPSIFVDYIPNARTGRKYDFKNTNGISDYKGSKFDIYRGMPIFENERGQLVFTSARDIGNISAGYMAAANGMPIILTRLAFDYYQSSESGKICVEGLSTQNAEWYGFVLGRYQTNSISRSIYFIRAVFEWGIFLLK